MLDINLIRENPEIVRKAAKDKGYNVDVDRVLELDRKNREIIVTAQRLLEERNKSKKDFEAVRRALEHPRQEVTPDVIKRALEVKQEIGKQEQEKLGVAKELDNLLLGIPNLAKDDVKVGKDESENEVIKKYKEPRKFDFKPRDHLELGEILDIIDVKRAAKVSGTRFGYLKNEGVLLEFALVQLAFETLIKEGFTPIIPPVLINQEITEGLGYWQGEDNKDYYLVGEPAESKNFYLVGTAEHAIVPMHKDETFDVQELPKRYVGFSTCFRREAGSYGKDTRGILRVHQFDKVEMVVFTTKENDDKEHEYLLSLEEKLFQMLDIPYQVVKMCTGDLGHPAARKYDIEAWMPSQAKYREVTSASTTTDYQARRLNIKYREGGKAGYVHMLNGTAFAIGRTIIAILENYQQEDGSVIIPEVLRSYLGKDKITSK